MNGPARILLRIFDGASSQQLAQVRQINQDSPTVVILRSGGKIAKEVPMTGDPEQSFVMRAVNGIRMGIYAREIYRAIQEGRASIPLDHPGSHRAVIGYRATEAETERAAEIRLAAELAALDFWRAKEATGMVEFFEGRVEGARQELARLRRHIPKRRRR
jgi:hypothetical protein